jgi:peroxiredoxin
VFGLSAQTSKYQREVKQRLHLPYELLSDSKLRLKASLSLPTFEIADMVLFKRLTIVAIDGRIAKVFYPVFPPDRNALDVVSWLLENAASIPN